MTAYASGIQPSELSLVEVSAPSSDAPGTTSNPFPALSLVDAPAAPVDTPSVTNKPSPELGLIDVPAASRGAPGVTNGPAPELGLVEVIEVHEPGYRAPPATSHGSAAPGADREQHAEKSAPHPHALRVSVDAGADTEAPDERTSKQTSRRHGGMARANRKTVTLVAGVLASLVVVIVAGVVVMRSESAPAQQLSAAKPASAAVASGPSTPSGPTTSEAANALGPLHDVPREDFASRVPALKSAGNWNVLVIYAAEWARKEPGNVEAWQELSMGYVKLRQFRDALDAATKAVEIAPGSFLAWQNLGKVNLALQDSAAALAAFERATALNDQDVVSLVQAGMLDARLGRLPEAKMAFAKALALSPEDVGALCGSASIAQKEGRLKDAEAMAQQLKSLDGICRDPTTGESVQVVVVSGSAKTKTVSLTGR